MMYKYAQLKRFHHECQLQVYMYALVYLDPNTMTAEGKFYDTRKTVVNYKKMSTLGPILRFYLGFS